MSKKEGSRIEQVPIEKLRAHPKNYRQHPDDQLDHIVASIKANGIYRNIVCANDYTVLAGHGVMKACQKMGMKEVPVIRLDFGPDDVRAMKVVTGDNEISHLGVIDDRLLSEILKDIKDRDEVGLLGTGYDEMMLASLVFVTRPDGEIKNFDAAAAWAGMPEYEEGKDAIKLVITFASEKDRKKFCDEKEIGKNQCTAKGLTWSTTWPWKENEDVSGIRFSTGKEENHPKQIDSDGGKRIRHKPKPEPINAPIFIPSLGRATIANTPRLLTEDGVPFKMVVEPQEADEYKKQFGSDSVLVLPEGGKGIAYSRRWIKSYSKENGHAYHWQIDDDVRAFMEKTSGKREKCSSNVVLGNIEAWVKKHSNVAIAAPLQTTWAWNGTDPGKEQRLNRPPVSCVLVSNEPKETWRDGIWEDTDYALQVLKAGWCTANFTLLLVDLPPMMKQPGGHTPLYKADGERMKAAKAMVDRWPGAFQIGDRFGLVTLLPSKIWKSFKQEPKKR